MRKKKTPKDYSVSAHGIDTQLRKSHPEGCLERYRGRGGEDGDVVREDELVLCVRWKQHAAVVVVCRYLCMIQKVDNQSYIYIPTNKCQKP